MKNYFSKLSVKLEKEITRISNSNQSEIQKCEARKLLTIEHYHELRKFVSSYQFKSEQEEIEYFRSQKPTFVASLMYYYKTSKITQQGLSNDCGIRKKILQDELHKVEIFYAHHLNFISYYNSGQTNFDEVLFLRKNMNPASLPSYILLHDDSYHITNGDYLVSKLILNLKLYKFIQNELNGQSENENSKTIKSDFLWTAPKSALIELIYALYYKGAINNGSAEIKQLVRGFELFFNVELGDPYRHFTNIKQRKKSTATFLESLTECLIRQMNEQDRIP